MNVLLPTDFSGTAKNAATYAFSFFEKTPCTFHLLHTFSEEKNNTGEVHVHNAFYADFEKFFSFLNTKKRTPQHNIKVTFQSKPLVEAVREEVLEKEIDLIVMGAKGAANKEFPVVGKNTFEVMQKVKCPILAVPEHMQFKGCKEILFPTDYKIHYDRGMLRTLLDFISTSKTKVKVLEIFDSDTELSAEQKQDRTALKQYFLPKVPLFRSFFSDNAVKRYMRTETDHSDMIAIAAKNLNVCQKLLFDHYSCQIPFIQKLPLLVLH